MGLLPDIVDGKMVDPDEEPEEETPNEEDDDEEARPTQA